MRSPANEIRVFISHHEVDTPWVTALAGVLERIGIKSFHEGCLLPGDPILGTKEEAIARADHVLVIVSPEAMARASVGQERWAFGAHRTGTKARIVPVVLREAALPPFMKDLVPVRVGRGLELAAPQCWSVLGEPGSGKSTLLKHLALVHAQKARADLEAGRDPGPAAIPLLVRLADLHASGEGPFEHIEQARGRLGVPEGTGAALEAQAAAGRVLFLLDGLDEVPAEGLRDLLVQVRRVAGERAWLDAGCRVVVTSRPFGYQAPAGHFLALDLLPLGAAGQRRLLEQWLASEGVGATEIARIASAIQGRNREESERAQHTVVGHQTSPESYHCARSAAACPHFFSFSRSCSVAIKIGSTILSFGRPTFAFTAINVGRSSTRSGRPSSINDWLCASNSS